MQFKMGLASAVRDSSEIFPDRVLGLKVCHWTKITNHYQRAFSAALGAICDLRTVYFENLPEDRLALGWNNTTPLLAHELRCDTLQTALKAIPDWKERLHIVPGYGGTFERELARHLTAHCVPWADWSESSTPGWKWYARLPVKVWWTALVRRAALGSFAIGSQAEDDFVRRGISRSKISYLPYVTPAVRGPVTPDPDIQDFKAGRRAFLFLGTLNKRKGTDLLINAAASVLAENSHWTLILVGNDTHDRKFKRMAQALLRPDQVLFRGSVHPNLISAVVEASDVLVLPSRYDGWGVVINEAVNGGRAVIASDQCGAARHLVVPGQNGFRVRAGSKTELEMALRRYARSGDLSVTHGKASRLISVDVDPDVNAKRMLLSLSVWLQEWRS